MHNPYRTVGYSCIVFAFALVVVFSWPRVVPQTPGANVSASAICADISPELTLMGKAAYAVDLTTGLTLYEKNADVQLPLASLTKLATAITASSILLPEDTVTITPEALTPDGDNGLKVGEMWKAEDLMDFTLMVSSNDGIHAIALAAAQKNEESLEAFIQAMNSKAHSLGMNETYFASDTGLDISSTTASAYGSAHDVATLISYIVRTDPRLVEGTHSEERTFTSLSGYTHTAQNTSSVIGSLDGAIASKTGYTDLAGGNLAVVFEPIPGRPVAAVILGSTRDGRDTDMQALAAGAKAALKRAIVCGNGAKSP